MIFTTTDGRRIVVIPNDGDNAEKTFPDKIFEHIYEIKRIEYERHFIKLMTTT